MAERREHSEVGAGFAFAEVLALIAMVFIIGQLVVRAMYGPELRKVEADVLLSMGLHPDSGQYFAILGILAYGGYQLWGWRKRSRNKLRLPPH